MECLDGDKNRPGTERFGDKENPLKNISSECPKRIHKYIRDPIYFILFFLSREQKFMCRKKGNNEMHVRQCT